MELIKIRNAYYVKLGEGDQYFDRSMKEKVIRVGWAEQSLDDIHNWREQVLSEKILLAKQKDGSSTRKGEVTKDVNALKKIAQSTPEDIWITFDRNYLWWCRVDDNKIDQDKISKFRKVEGEWHNHDIDSNHLLINEIPGRLAAIQRFSGTICNLDLEETGCLSRLLNNQPSTEFQRIKSANELLTAEVEKGLSLLHWKDFETLVDLIFRNAGWRRVSMVGESMKYVDMVLEEPINGFLYQVQVKSDATLKDFKEYAEKFSDRDFKGFYFIVHNSQEKWTDAPAYSNVQLVLQERLAKMVVDLGLVKWLLKKVR